MQQDPDVVEKVVSPELIRYDSIDHNALKRMNDWSHSYFKEQWLDVPRCGRGHPKAISLSLWHGQTLCGLCFATPKRSKFRIKLMLVEGHPDSTHPLKGFVAAMMITAVEDYAKLIDLPSILIPKPLPEVVPLYKKLGFAYNQDKELVKPIDLAVG